MSLDNELGSEESFVSLVEIMLPSKASNYTNH